MLAVVFSLPLVIGALVWRSFRRDRAARARGAGYAPGDRIRW